MFLGFKWLILAFVLLVTKMQVIFCVQQVIFCVQQVPCYFIFGDSLVESGNNNDLPTTAKTNFPPYGIDFPNGVATGRFTNGRTTVDVIAQLLGITGFIPTFASSGATNFLTGLNYASGASGIRPETGAESGYVISMDAQLGNHYITFQRVNMSLGNTTRTFEYLRKCLYTVGMGANDYINNYLRPEFYYTSQYYTPQAYANELIRAYNIQLRTLYNLGARKVAISSIGSLGCTPSQIARYGPNASGCVDSTTNMARMFDVQLRPLVDQLNRDLSGANFTLINSTSISSGTIPGITVVNAPCCAVSNLTGLCNQNSVPCSNRNAYVFYDAFHPTDIINNVSATRSYHALLPSDTYPFDISHLVRH